MLEKMKKKYCVKTENPNYELHHFDTPFRSLVVAPSGSGKSNFITNLITLFVKAKGLMTIFIYSVNVKTNHYTAI